MYMYMYMYMYKIMYMCLRVRVNNIYVLAFSVVEQCRFHHSLSNLPRLSPSLDTFRVDSPSDMCRAIDSYL